MATDLSRYRTQLTQAEAIELCEVLDSCDAMSIALMRVHSKLKIFVAQVQMGSREPSYVPQPRNEGPHNGITKEIRTVMRKQSQETDPRKVLYHELLEDPEVSDELKNTLMTEAIFDKYPEIDPRTGVSVVPQAAPDLKELDEESI